MLVEVRLSRRQLFNNPTTKFSPGNNHLGPNVLQFRFTLKGWSPGWNVEVEDCLHKTLEAHWQGSSSWKSRQTVPKYACGCCKYHNARGSDLQQGCGWADHQAWQYRGSAFRRIAALIWSCKLLKAGASRAFLTNPSVLLCRQSVPYHLGKLDLKQ